MVSGLGLGPRSEYGRKVTSLTLRPAASEASDETENSDRSVVTDSWEGERSMRQPTVNTGVWGGPFDMSSPAAMTAWPIDDVAGRTHAHPPPSRDYTYIYHTVTRPNATFGNWKLNILILAKIHHWTSFLLFMFFKIQFNKRVFFTT